MSELNIKSNISNNHHSLTSMAEEVAVILSSLTIGALLIFLSFGDVATALGLLLLLGLVMLLATGAIGIACMCKRLSRRK